MAEFFDVAGVDDVAEGQMVSVQAEGHRFLLANAGGAVHVADGFCPHLHARLDKGTLEGTLLTCPLHGSQFDLVDGRCVRWTEFSGVVKSVAEVVRHPRPLRVYEVMVEDGRILVGPQKAPPV